MTAFPSMQGSLTPLTLRQTKLITASGDSIVTKKVPFRCRIVTIWAGVEGIDDATAVDVDLENGTTDIGDPITVATGSAIVAGGVEGAPDAGQEELAAGDVIHMDIDITGGTAPDINGAWATLWVQRLP